MAAVTPVKYDPAAKQHKPFVNGDVIPASDIQISPDSNNLLRDDGNGLLVKLEAAPDIANQYVSSSSGNDATGDGTQGNPFKTLRHALDRVPDYTSATIWLKAGDTFRPEDGVSGYVAGGTLAQHTAADLAIGHRDITLLPYGNATFDTVRATPGVDSSLYEIGTQPIIIFTFSGNSDNAGSTTAPGFSVRGGELHLTQVTLRVEGNAPKGYGSLGTSPLAPWAGVADLSGCNIQTATGTLISGPADNTASGTINVHYCRFDNSRGADFLGGRLGVTLKADLGDSDGSGPLPGHADIKTRVTNFNSLVAAHGSSFFPDLTVISASARTYEGLITTNNIIAAA